MRLKSLHVKDFRSIDGEVSVSLDAPIVLIHGPNGAGKTSLLSALELALTGSVPSLSRAEPDYLRFLPHKDRPHGLVRLEVDLADGSTANSEIKVTTGGIRGTPILRVDDATFFSERSFLAQSTLGRLLEMYQHSEKKSDTPLTRFVKELLGLDRMEAVIEGLHSAGNITRLKAPVPDYGAVREEIAGAEAEIADLVRQVEASVARGAELIKQLEEVFSSAQIPQPIYSSRHEIDTALAGNYGEDILRNLLAFLREVDVAGAGIVGTSDADPSLDRSAIERSNQDAQAASNAWAAEHADDIEAVLGRAEAGFADASATSGDYSERGRLISVRLGPELQRISDLLSRHEQAEAERARMEQALAEATTRLKRLDEQINTAAGANEAMARALSELSTHIHGDICPVCDRDFSDVGEVPLATHIAHKVGAIIDHAGRLQALTRDRSTTNASIADLERQLSALVTAIIPETELSQLKSRAADFTEIRQRLEDLAPQMQVGNRLRSAAAEAARRLFVLQNADHSIVVRRQAIEDIARRAGISFDENMATEPLLSAVRDRIQLQHDQARRLQETHLGGARFAQRLLAEDDARDALLRRRQALENRLASLRERKGASDRIIDTAKDLVRNTREARGQVVRKVFNDELNATWRDLFVRLAPEEPFIPAFAIPDGTSGDIEAVLETHHRRGGKGGNPRAMLSSGNLNTAALTLFLSLHLSVKARLPWLVIDDPVQSMDEVHIAQFAALLRMVSKQMKRQVIIAVHERSLFDYLALELSPAFEGDRLNVIELGRNAMGQTTGRWDPRLFVEDKAVAA
ncbi:AAA family ATPase [Mesorhizobium sp. B283B1A]|uniref:AAA family ATPase n=1 Tax=Mesorhizobium TaxID=68287 RepID=UPI001CD18911|nr:MULTISPECIES: AAA family ATPase [Mesorhizobium]MCA0050621.1 AAA family ATPase [Mesorhizobium sp. B283B1A]UQS66947.1 AAA family ATPase [Mesorhizobium opportunistum]